MSNADDVRKLIGHATVRDASVTFHGPYRDAVAPGSFRKVLAAQSKGADAS